MLSWIVLLLVAAVWGGAFAAIRFILAFISPADLLVARMLPTAVICLLVALLFYRRETLRLFPRYWRLFVTITVLWLFGYHYALNVGETVLPAGPAGLIIGTYPVFTVFLAAPLLGERLTAGKIAGGLTAFAGTAFLMLFGASHEGAQLHIEPSRWILFSLITLIAPVSAAFHTIAAKPYLTGENRDRARIDPTLMTMLYMAPASIFLIPMIAADPQSVAPAMPLSAWIALAFLVIFCTLGAYVGWLWGVERLGAGPAATSTYIIPLFSLAYARIWLGEPIGPGTIVGAVLIVAGVIAANVGWKVPRGSAVPG